jgi:AcrR family transcriptional regulator
VAVDLELARTRVLDAAETLFYARGVQAVGMDELRAAAGVSLKRLYQCFSSKDAIVDAYLRRRDERWRAALRDYVAIHAATVEQRIPAVFDWLADWFAAPDFRGCAFVNSFGELGGSSDTVAAAARDHQVALRDYLADLLLPAPDADFRAGQLLLLITGATVLAAVHGDPGAASRAAALALSVTG